jgi:hypothetical protein
LKVEAVDEKPADDGKEGELSHGSRHDDPGLTGDAPEIVGGQFHSDDGHREKDKDRNAGLHDRLQQGTFPDTRAADPRAASRPSAQRYLCKTQSWLVLAYGVWVSSAFTRRDDCAFGSTSASWSSA